ncbi:DUF726-domain-containing protein [Rostrohypoxylon terebratum]|nr:DUF726-domain-containing protein [Rostrohypoxylon terebratum]
MAPVGRVQELDDFGLPIRKYVSPKEGEQHHDNAATINATNGTEKDSGTTKKETEQSLSSSNNVSKPETVKKPEKDVTEAKLKPPAKSNGTSAANSDDEDFQDAPSTPQPELEFEPELKSESEPKEPSTQPKSQAAQDVDEAKTPLPTQSEFKKETIGAKDKIDVEKAIETKETKVATPSHKDGPKEGSDSYENTDLPQKSKRKNTLSKDVQAISGPSIKQIEASKHADEAKKSSDVGHSRDVSLASTNHDVSEFSHQQLTGHHEEKKDEDEDEWQAMPAYAPYDIYDDDNRLVAKEHNPDEDDNYGYGSLGGAGKGYTRVLDDEDAESETSMDDNTRYLFKDPKSTSMTEMDEEQRDAVSQLQATKDLLTEGQRIAYVGVTRLELSEMVKEAESIVVSKRIKKEIQTAAEALKMWSQKIMIRLYAHMEISPAEQVMIEQLAEHGVIPKDLTPALMQNSRVKNPMAEQSTPSSTPTFSLKSPRSSISTSPGGEKSAEPPPPYESHEGEEMPEVRTPSQLPSSEKIDIDLRWTVLCDLFLVLIADSIYDARSRVLLERVGKDLDVPWIDICRFEKRVTDALEMQQQAEKENWNEDEHLENRRKLAQKRRYVMMGLATVGGGLVIGLSAGLLAPLIGAGLAAGFTTIGVGGTSSFLAGAGGAAIITSSAAASGSFMGGKAAGRRTGAVKTFEYRPLHNNKRVNLIVTISGWMTSKNDDVRLPFSTIDPVMGDIYSILWEPEMLTSMGDTINILATEALTQGLQQVLGSTILISLMAALQLPVVLTKLAYLIDNPWAVSLDRAWSAGLILADSLIDRNLGTRPITLVGYSLGSRVIFSCLLELARKGAYGLVQNVYLFGAPIVVKKEEFLKVRTVVAGRFINGYNRTDWILGYLFRLTNGGIRRVAGLATVDDIPGLENFDCTDFVVGHMEYRTAMPILLRECGWLVESDEFGEIEDPDPDRYRERQRELISEIEEARKELEKEESTKKGGWGIFGRKKKGARQEWEVYEDTKKVGEPSSKTEDKEGNNHGVLFDVDAMRAELAKEEELEVRELKSTLPPMKLDVSPPPRSVSTSAIPSDVFHKAKSSGDIYGSGGRSSSYEYRVSQERTPTRGLGFDIPPLEEPEIQMTFDTAFTEPHHDIPPPPPAKDYPPSRSPSALSRPEIKSSQTTPNIALKDPWADDDDEEFGKEKEMTMTFA